MHWRDPREVALLMGKATLALVGAMFVTGLMVLVFPLGDVGPRTSGRIIVVVVFYGTWSLLLFKFIFGEFIPREAFKNNGN